MQEISLDLRAQYRIKYQSTNDSSKTGFRKVEAKFVSSDGQKRKLIVPPDTTQARKIVGDNREKSDDRQSVFKHQT